MGPILACPVELVTMDHLESAYLLSCRAILLKCVNTLACRLWVRMYMLKDLALKVVGKDRQRPLDSSHLQMSVHHLIWSLKYHHLFRDNSSNRANRSSMEESALTHYRRAMGPTSKRKLKLTLLISKIRGDDCLIELTQISILTQIITCKVI